MAVAMGVGLTPGSTMMHPPPREPPRRWREGVATCRVVSSYGRGRSKGSTRFAGSRARRPDLAAWRGAAGRRAVRGHVV